MRYYCLLLWVWMSTWVMAQELDTVPYTLYFDTDSYTPSAQALEQLTAFLEQTPFEGTVQQLIIEGHTDQRASAAYNLNLSKKRAAALERFLLQYYQKKQLPLPTIKVAFYGEEQPALPAAKGENLRKNRRVVLHWIIEKTAPIPLPPPVVEEFPEPPPPPVLPEEPKDSPIVLNVRDYLFYMPSQEVAEEARIEVVKTGAEAYTAGLTTVTTDGKLLYSTGMFRVCGDPEVDEFKVRMPVLDSTAAVPSYYVRVGERWELTERAVTKVKDEQTGQWYYELQAENCTWVNGDVEVERRGIIVRVPIQPFWVKKMNILGNAPIVNYPLKARGLNVHAAAGFSDDNAVAFRGAVDSAKTMRVELLGQPNQAKSVAYAKLNYIKQDVKFPMLVISEKKYKRLLDRGHDGYLRCSRLASIFLKTEPIKHTIYRIRAKDLRAARRALRQELKAQKLQLQQGDIGGL